MAEYIDVEDMVMMGYKQLPVDENGNGKWCFKPKTFLDFCNVRSAKSNYPEIPDSSRDERRGK